MGGVVLYCEYIQVSRALKLSTERSLIILDEFGKGTATVSHYLTTVTIDLTITLCQVDGLSLLVALLRQWVQREERCPNIIVSTHFHSIIKQKLLPETPLIEYLVQYIL